MSGDRKTSSQPSSIDQAKAKSLRQNPFTSRRDPETGEWQVFFYSAQQPSGMSLRSIRNRRDAIG
ncbi:MAG: hypothetical protein AAFY26_04240 [Cyanobacteria bacterium J06638_22]